MERKCQVVIGNEWPDCKPRRCGRPAIELAIEDFGYHVRLLCGTFSEPEYRDCVLRQSKEFFYFCPEHAEEWKRIKQQLGVKERTPDDGETVTRTS